MAITKEMLSANAVLTGLTEEQITAITTLSQNDENSVIGTRIGEIYRQMDATIAEQTGIERNGDEKTYLYLQRATKAVKEKADKVDALNANITELKNEKARLQKLVDEGGADEEIKKQLKQARTSLETVTQQYASLKMEFDTAKEKHTKELFDLRINADIESATANIKFKSDYPDSVKEVILSQVISKVKGMNPEYVDNGTTKVLTFMKDGAPMLNPENLMKPYTAQELINKELKTMGVLADDKGGGGGTGDPKPKPNGGTIDLTGIKTQMQATEMINKALCTKGLAKGTAEYQTEFDKMWKENEISKLPFN